MSFFSKLCYSAVLLSTAFAQATSIAPVKLNDLFPQADQVVLVKVLSGDSEHYGISVYKAVVEDGFKGATNGQIIFFGPFDGYAIGNEYLLFLKRGKTPGSAAASGLYGSLPSVSTIMYEGYAALAVGYECVFDGLDVSQQCDQSVKLNPEQIVLPSDIKTFPEGDPTPVTNYKKWVRKEIFLQLLRQQSK